MKPNFALSLSFEGIALLHRAAGGWRRVGTVALDTPDLGADLAALRRKALVLEPEGPRCKIVIPNDQIRYMTLETGAVGGDARIEAVRAALADATPYALDELAFDISVDGAQTHVAAVARETLAEAEAFAIEHRLHPISFVAAPFEMPFLGEPFFGEAAHAASLPDADAIEPDGIAVVVVGDAVMPEPPRPARDAIQPSPAKAPETRPDTAPPVPGFSSRRGKVETSEQEPDNKTAPVAPELGGASRDDVVPRPQRRLQLVPDAPKDVPRITSAPAVATIAPAALEPAPVTAPTLDIPDFAIARKPDRPARPSMRRQITGFFSRRKTAPAKPAKARIAEARAMPITSPPSPRIADLPPDDETARMTLFGARQQTTTRGKPRHLGLILTVALLLLLAGIAAWATIFLDDGLAGLFRDRVDATDVAIVPQPAKPEPTPVAASLPALNLPAPQAVPLARYAPQTASVDPEAPLPGLSDTDSAVLDALREPDAQAPRDAAADAAIDPAEGAVEDTATYAATGIWQTAPDVPETPAIIGLDDLYVASIDRTDLSQDAVALPPAPGFDTDQPLASRTSPAAAETRFVLDARGLVTPTAAGTISPEGVTVYLGRPSRVPPPTPVRRDSGAEAESDAVRERLAGLRPRPRPGDLVERRERAQLGGLSREELGGLRPRLRPENAKTEKETDQTPTDLAVASSRAPKARPKDFAATVREAARQDTPTTSTNDEADGEPDSGQVTTAAPVPASPKIPSSASVARQATLDNAINLSKVNLIGVYGTPSNRRALVRLPNGRYKKVKVGDAVDGGRVVAIGDSELRYQKGGRNMTLKIPSG